MHPELVFVYDIAIIFALSAVALYLCHVLKVPSIMGFLVAGIAAGPGGFGLISSAETVAVLSELGVVLLLFSIGVEFSFQHLVRIKKAIFVGGALQVGVTALVAYGISSALGAPWETSLVVGFLVALSSTAIVLKMLQDAGETGTPHGRMMLAFLIFQDIAVIPMMLVIPWLGAHGADFSTPDLLVSVGKGVGLAVIVVVAAKYIVPRLLQLVVATRSKELFLLVVVLVCFATAGATAWLGLSLALGAFVAGLVISESEFSHHALGNVIPFRDIFLSFFFVSVGMLLDLGTVINAPLTVAGIALSVIGIKALIAAGSALLLKQPVRTAILTGMMLGQIGEFSFILAGVALTANVLPMEYYQLFLAAAIITIALTPLLQHLAPRLADAVLARLPHRDSVTEYAAANAVRDHLVLIGFGLNGQNIARAARKYGIVYRILEMNNETVNEYAAKGEPIYFGDATQKATLHLLDVVHARTAVIAISDAAATRRIVEVLREASPNVHIIARTRFVSEVEPLATLGANEVIPEEFETAIEVFARVLRHYDVPDSDVRASVLTMRQEHYKVFRSEDPPATTDLGSLLQRVAIESVRVHTEHQCSGRPISELDLRKRFGVTVLGIHRAGALLPNPGANETVEAGDILVLMGEHSDIAAAGEYLTSRLEPNS